MPEMDGYDVCERLKLDARTRDVPIIFISALDATQDKVRAFQAGGVDYVTKPFQAAEVLARVETHLALRALQQQLQDRNEAMARELALAGEIQASFLPSSLPELPGWQLAAAFQPAGQAAGDFYDLISLPGGRLGIVMADVAGKGAGAALYMALSCTLIRTYAEDHPAKPDLVLAAANQRILKDTSAGQFVTVFYGILDPATGMLVYSNAGHCPALQFRTQDDDEVQGLIRTGMPLGLFADATWGLEAVELGPGGLLVLYTDGISEAHHELPDLFGEERLLASVRAGLDAAGARRPPAEEIRDRILADVHDFVDGTPQPDDIALVLLLRE
jgi:sigma-B regulation protein RsbU (phosphoserine phosphatase)